jgi:hypothetical protein
VSKDGYGLVNPQVSNGEGFFEVVHAEPVGMLCSDGGHDIDAVAVGVGFNYGHYGRARGYNRSESIKVSSNSGRIDFNPGQHRNILF